MSNTMYLIRGLSGAGKSTTAASLPISEVFEADDFFMVDGEYSFNPSRLKDAHADCLSRAVEAMKAGKDFAVSNTFTQQWEMDPYLAAAEEHGITVDIVDIFDGGMTDEELHARNVHNVPLETIKRQRERYQH